MPSKTSALLVICIIVVLCATTTLGSPILDDLFRGFIRDSQLAGNQPPKGSPIVKRRIFDENPDAKLKQVSLQSLIGDVEDSLYHTALSVSSVAHNSEAVVPEVKPSHNSDDRSIIKRETEEETEAVKNEKFVTTTTTESSAGQESKSIFLQTTQKVPAGNGVPAHILIDRVAVQPHQGGLPIIPAFQVYHTKVISATFKEPNSGAGDGSSNGGNGGSASGSSTKISIAQTAVQTTNAAGVGGTAGVVPVITISTTKQNGNLPTITTITENSATPLTTGEFAGTTASTQANQHHTDEASTSDGTIATSSSENVSVTDKTVASTTSTLSPATTTTKLPITQLKEAEEELKEKVAEIEAEPIILTARV